MCIRSEGTPFRGEPPLVAYARVLQLGGQAEEGGEGIRHTEELDHDPTSSGGAGIARQPLGKRETVMRSLRDA